MPVATAPNQQIPLVDGQGKLTSSGMRVLQSYSDGLNGGAAPEANVMQASLGSEVVLFSGTGTPEGAVTAPRGSLYINLAGGAGTTLYVKQTGAGNTGWAGK